MENSMVNGWEYIVDITGKDINLVKLTQTITNDVSDTAGIFTKGNELYVVFTVDPSDIAKAKITSLVDIHISFDLVQAQLKAKDECDEHYEEILNRGMPYGAGSPPVQISTTEASQSKFIGLMVAGAGLNYPFVIPGKDNDTYIIINDVSELSTFYGAIFTYCATAHAVLSGYKAQLMAGTTEASQSTLDTVVAGYKTL